MEKNKAGKGDRKCWRLHVGCVCMCVCLCVDVGFQIKCLGGPTEKAAFEQTLEEVMYG